ncbi:MULTISPECIES: hypothetical protein [unclassified Bradyrhizobium]|uniref:hypothetical protein n=1 Tax=unclassified Bradyrhizobium TaxID=2631580 RepID=UPI0024E15142|nr:MULTISPECIES: hypothetical protein [unclassified Bradyrhizobium]
MTSIRHRLLAITLLASSFASAASADDTVDVARAWGLIGTWALDCEAPPVKGRGTIISYEVTPDGNLIYRRDHDPSDINEVASARVEPDQTLVLSIVLPRARQTRENGIVKTPDGGIRSAFNRGEDGSYTIRDGRFVANGKPTPQLSRCD